MYKYQEGNSVEGAEAFCVTRIKLAIVKAYRHEPIGSLLSRLSDVDFIEHIAFTRGETKGVHETTDRWDRAMRRAVTP